MYKNTNSSDLPPGFTKEMLDAILNKLEADNKQILTQAIANYAECKSKSDTDGMSICLRTVQDLAYVAGDTMLNQLLEFLGSAAAEIIKGLVAGFLSPKGKL